jgi:hypothetical protein
MIFWVEQVNQVILFFNALRKNGIESKMLVQTKLSHDDDIVQFEYLKKLVN